MQVPEPKINLSVQFGQDLGQPVLARVVARNHPGTQEVNIVKNKAKINELIGEQLVCLIRYSVYPGRQAEALKYLQEGFNQTITKDLMSPLQFITCKGDEDQCQSSLYAEEGAICVKYKFKLDEIEEKEQELLASLNQFSKLQTEVILKGRVSHTLKNRTTVKADYSYVNFTGQEISLNLLHNILMQHEDILPEQLVSNPFYITLKKARKLNLSLRFKQFRQIKRYHDDLAKALGNWNFSHKAEKNDFKYQAPGLFRQSVEAYAFLKDDFAVSADITHQGEDIFLRLIKVYFKATQKALDL